MGVPGGSEAPGGQAEGRGKSSSPGAAAAGDAPALSTSTAPPGMGVTSEPVAMRMFLASWLTVAPSAPATSTPWGPVILPLPLR